MNVSRKFIPNFDLILSFKNLIHSSVDLNPSKSIPNIFLLSLTPIIRQPPSEFKKAAIVFKLEFMSQSVIFFSFVL